MILPVTAGIILRDNRVLVVQRRPGSRRGLLWEFPGGKVEPDENPRQSLKRELEEEVGIEVEVGRRFEMVYQPYPDMRILLMSYLCRLVRGEPRPLHCHRIRWVTGEELNRLPMAKADILLRNALCVVGGFLDSSPGKGHEHRLSRSC
ncbi:MAG: NUDIX domain-containing protein [Deltaproteobacteria bacterium]|nr:NUDIX domain-containing protein [Deltaproteobacteria bacterium]MBW2121636.1 NUDIX domain-containing protein [Deltaproteobacteria bacterium]